MKTTQEYIDFENQYIANNYHPVPVVIKRGQGVYVWDVEDKRYLDFMSAYSAVSHGHCHPRLLKALIDQVDELTLVSRAYHSDKLGVFLQRACELTGQDKAIPMNTGAEAVETALKAARKWAYTVKGVAKDKAEIIACRNNFHGRTITITSMSTEPQYRSGFGPFTPGFKTIPFGDESALREVINENTAAFLVEPMQGEAGMLIPPPGYLKACQEICNEHNVLLICDEIQTGLGRTGKFIACEHEDVKPDGLILGKSLGGGILPISLFLSRKEVMDVFQPGDHGSTFGGNQLACAVGLESLNVIVDERLSENALELGAYFKDKLLTIDSPLIQEVRGIGLFIGIEIDPKYSSAREVVLRLKDAGVLSKDTHETVVRLAPPLVATRKHMDKGFEIIKSVLETND